MTQTVKFPCIAGSSVPKPTNVQSGPKHCPTQDRTALDSKGEPSILRTLLQLLLPLVGMLASLGAAGQSSPSGPRVGYLSLAAEDSPQAAFRAAFLSGIRELGYVGSRAPVMTYRFAEGDPTKLPALAAALIQSGVDVLVGEGQQASFALKGATSTVPVVTLSCDAVTSGLVSQLARPGGNVTGISCLTPELTVKRVQLLHEINPSMKRFGILWNSHDPSKVKEVDLARDAANKMGISHISYEVRTVEEIETSFAKMRDDGIDGVLLIGDSFMILHRRRIVASVAELRVPAIYPFRDFVDAGGLLCYGPSLPAMFHSLAGYVDKILKGSKPGDLPVAQPTIFDFTVNLPVARSASIAMPKSLLVQAGQVID